MSDIRQYVHPKSLPPMRADKAVAAFLSSETSRSRLEESFRSGGVRMNGTPVSKKFEVRAGDVLEIKMPPSPETEITPVDIPVEILYEDEDVVVVNKPAGMTVHPGSGTGADTLVHAMMHRCGGNLSFAGGTMRPGIVHRLDKETSGALIMAKNDNAYFRLVEIFSKRMLDKEYLAIASGVPTGGSGVINKPIGRHPTFKTKMCVIETGRDARTEWVLVEKFGGRASLLSCKIRTGRTHQIRVHLKDLGFPIFGDYTYGFQKNKFREIPAPQRVMLHARRLSLEHPTQRGKSIDVEAPPPEDFSELLNTLRNTYI